MGRSDCMRAREWFKTARAPGAIACWRLLLMVALLPALVLARDAREQARIEFLIREVETSRGLTFIRNGSEHDGAAAAKHLRRKLNHLGERLKTAEQFIQHCATESSITGRNYQVKTAEGKTVAAATYFTERLREFDQQKR
jgi:hypothetical protein